MIELIYVLFRQGFRIPHPDFRAHTNEAKILKRVDALLGGAFNILILFFHFCY